VAAQKLKREKLMKQTCSRLAILSVALATFGLHATPVGTAFTYQGRLTVGANPANGTYYMYFSLYDAASGGNLVASQPTNTVSVTSGLFTVDLDFGPVPFDGSERWLQINVRTNGGVAVDLSQRTRLAPAPHAIYASTSGTVANGAIYATQLATLGSPSPGQVLGYNGSSLVWQTAGGSGPWLSNNSDVYYNGGNVGIGTTSPSTYGHGGTAEILEVHNSGTAVHSQAHLMLYSGVNSIANSSIGTITWAQPGGMAAHIAALTRSATPGTAAGSLMFGTRGAADPASIVRMVIQDSGNVGIGTTSPQAKLHVQGNQTTTGNLNVGGDVVASSHSVQFDNVSDHHQWSMESQSPGNLQFVHSFQNDLTGIFGSENLLTMTTHGNIGIGTANPQAKLHVIGTVNATAGVVIGNNPGTTDAPIYSDSPASSRVILWNTATAGLMDLTCKHGDVSSLTIRGGADLAEPFAMSQRDIEPGTVVVIDEENPGKLKSSTRAYDKQVAGIVSGANGVRPGISMIQEDKLELGENVALSGRVYVRADASNGAIRPGDLLTTSDTPGHAMKVTDYVKAHGAIIGKAMVALHEGRGMVLVLVTLQ
jgi:hypothetical protein